MPPCNKELNIMKSYTGNKIALTVRCCESLNHIGEHEWHLWTDAENEFQKSGKGMVKIIK